MHYIRLLRPAKIEIPSRTSSSSSNRKKLQNAHISILVTITTDLGDSFLCPDEPVQICVEAKDIRGDSVLLPRRRLQTFEWRAGMRVLELKAELDSSYGGYDANSQRGLTCTIWVYQGAPAVRQNRSSSLPRPIISGHIVRASAILLPWKTGTTTDDHDDRDIHPVTRDADRNQTETFKSQGLIMPVSVGISRGVCEPVAVQTICLAGADDKSTIQGGGLSGPCGELNLQFEEDIGESIARHIWDAGVTTAAYLAELCNDPTQDSESKPLILSTLDISESKDNLNFLELGSGVGILGISIAACLAREKSRVADQGIMTKISVLLTDLAEAEERARSNISRAQEVLSRVLRQGQGKDSLEIGDRPKDKREDKENTVEDESETLAATIMPVSGTATTAFANPESEGDFELLYENLDWEDGRRGIFGPIVASRIWDLVVLSDCTYNVDSLPALVGTLSALHSAKTTASQERGANAAAESSVLLATKPRHESEKALFGLLDDEGWRYRVLQVIPLPGLGRGREGEDEVVEIYLLEKGRKSG